MMIRFTFLCKPHNPRDTYCVGGKGRCETMKSTSIGIALMAGVCLYAVSGGGANAATTCTFTTDFTTIILDADCTTDATIFVPDGFTLDGAGQLCH